jgi:tRNA (cytidine/uridine-2'-O-)-methyltransferase
MFHVALFNPRIAPNTGNIIRLIANNDCILHLIEPLGFELEEKKLRRAGLDYTDLNRVNRHSDYGAFSEAVKGRRVFGISIRGTARYDNVQYQPGDVFLFGSETSGLPQDIRESLVEKGRLLRIPMLQTSRSMNLSNSVAVVTYEAWRQVNFAGGQ